jgi:hypothetical protein
MGGSPDAARTRHVMPGIEHEIARNRMRVRLFRAGTAAATVTVGLTAVATMIGPASAAVRPDGWMVEPAGNRAGASLTAVAAKGTNRWAVGSVATPTGSRPLIEQNTGAGWRVSLPNVGAAGGSLSGVAVVSARDVWAVGTSAGNPLALHYDGTGWKAVATAPNPSGDQPGGRLSAVAAVSATDVWAVGSRPTDDGPGVLVQHWNGHRWSFVPAPAQPPTDFNALTGLAVVNAHDIWAVGSRGDDFNEPLVEHWDGTAWRVVAVPEPPQPDPADPKGVGLTAVTAVSAHNVWAVGESGLIEHYDGHTWRIVTGPRVPGDSTGTRWAAVSARAADDIWVVGRFGTVPLSAHWTGTAWQLVPVPTGTTLDGVVAARTGGTTAVGTTSTGTAARALILHTRR